MTIQQEETTVSQGGWRIKLGTAMFTIPFVMFIGAPIVVPLLGLSGTQTAAVIGGVIVAAEVIWFASIPLLGKEGFFAMKKKAFSFLKLKESPISESRHKLGAWLFCLGLGGQLLLHAVMIVAYAIVGAHPERILLGMDFNQQLALYFSALVMCVVSLIAGVYALGADFAGRCREVFLWPEHA